MTQKKIKLLCYDLIKNRTFYKYFNTEWEKDKFIIKLSYSKKLKALKEY